MFATVNFTFAEFQELDLGKSYNFSYFDYGKNQDVRNKLKLISINQEQEFINVEDNTGRNFILKRKQIARKQRPYLFKIDYKPKEIKAVKEDEIETVVENYEIGKEYNLSFIDSNGIYRSGLYLIRNIEKNKTYIKKDSYSDYFTFDNISLKTGMILMPDHWNKLKPNLVKAIIGQGIAHDLKVNTPKKIDDIFSSYPSYDIKITYGKFNNNIKEYSISYTLSSKKYGLTANIKLTHDFKSGYHTPLEIRVLNVESMDYKSISNTFNKAIKSKDLSIRNSGYIILKNLENIKINCNRFLTLSFQ